MDWRKAVKQSSLNLSEHFFTRSLDAITTLVLIACYTPDVFSKLALSQAMIVPLLFFSFAPEMVWYRDFGVISARGEAVTLKYLRTFRLFNWGKGLVAVLIAAGLAWLVGGQGLWQERFFPLLWALWLSLAPQILSADREFLRMSLKLKQLNFLTLFQKFLLLGLTWVAAVIFPNQVMWLCLAVGASTLLTAIVSVFLSRCVFSQAAFTDTTEVPEKFWSIIKTSIQSFSFWQSISGVVFNWVQTMDLLVLGWLRLSAYEVGLYAAVLKLGNLALALPLALSNFFGVWLGRQTLRNSHQEEGIVRKVTLSICGLNFIQILAFWLLAPFILHFLSRGRWSGEDQHQMIQWLKPILLGVGILGSLVPLNTWLMVRFNLKKMVLMVHALWGTAALALYFCLIKGSSHPFQSASLANIPVMGVLGILLLIYYTIERKSACVGYNSQESIS